MLLSETVKQKSLSLKAKNLAVVKVIYNLSKSSDNSKSIKKLVLIRKRLAKRLKSILKMFKIQSENKSDGC